MTVEQVWQYGQERGEETFSLIISNVEYLPLTRNRLIVPGIVENPPDYYAKIIEVTYPDKMVVFEATVHFKNLLAGELSETPYDTIYRSHRISIYP
jgi:arylsulfate sulfotransferase